MKSRASLIKKRNQKGYLFVLPFIIGLVLFFIPAVIQSFRFGFSDLRFIDIGYKADFVGFKHYERILFVDPDFVRNVVASLGTMLLSVVLIIIYSLLIAIILNKDIKGKGVLRALLFLPVVIATGIIARVDTANVLTSNTGAVLGAKPQAGEMFTSFDISELVSGLNLNNDLLNIVVDAVQNIYHIITRSGVQMLIFLAGLQGISPSVYESARVEGATWWETLWKITVPMISPLILVNLVYSIVDSFTAAGNTVMDRIFLSITSLEYSSASVMAFMYFIVVAVVLAGAFLLVRKLVFYETV